MSTLVKNSITLWESSIWGSELKIHLTRLSIGKYVIATQFIKKNTLKIFVNQEDLDVG